MGLYTIEACSDLKRVSLWETLFLCLPPSNRTIYRRYWCPTNALAQDRQHDQAIVETQCLRLHPRRTDNANLPQTHSVKSAKSTNPRFRIPPPRHSLKIPTINNLFSK